MPEAHSRSSGPSMWVIERPRCPKCHIRTSLARIMPGPEGYDLRYFKCAKCGEAISLKVATDPMKSDALRWLAGELKPPNKGGDIGALAKEQGLD